MRLQKGGMGKLLLCETCQEQIPHIPTDKLSPEQSSFPELRSLRCQEVKNGDITLSLLIQFFYVLMIVRYKLQKPVFTYINLSIYITTRVYQVRI